MLKQLIYTSRATTRLSDVQLTSILNKSVARNHQNDITGMLLYRDGCFMQLLEGPADKVSTTFETIRNDPRHRNVVAHLITPCREREFGEWYMGFRNLNNPELNTLPFYAPYLARGFHLELLAKNPQVCMAILKTFAEPGSGLDRRAA